MFDAVNNAGTFRYGDFQVSPNGDFAVFTSALPLTPSVDNAGFTQVYRYDASARNLTACPAIPPVLRTKGKAYSQISASVSPTTAGSSSNPPRPWRLATGTNKTDVYEWEPQGTDEAKGGYECQTAGGCIGLISTGTSRFESKLLGVSVDGTDAFFFTRDVLVPQDENGTLVKIYDARELGGFPYIPPPVPCKASDECHGPSSPTPPAPNIGTLTGSGGNLSDADQVQEVPQARQVREPPQAQTASQGPPTWLSQG